MEVIGGKSGRVRLAEGEIMHVRVTLSAPSHLAKVRLWTNVGPAFPAPAFHWEEMQADGDKHFHLALPTYRPGGFYFTLQYTLDGHQWYWQRGDFWQVRVFPKQLKSLRLYTLIPTASGPMTSWEKVLQEAADLNFNMIHILPLTRQGASQSPYAAADLFALDPDLISTGASSLDMSCFEKLVGHAQSLGLGLCLDLVLNHVAFDSDLAKRCPHWIQSDPLEEDGFKRAGFMTQEGFQKWNDLVLVHYNHPDIVTRLAIWDYMKHYAMFWASYAAATQGMIRLDNLHSTHAGFAMHLTHELRQYFPQLGILGELFTTHEETQQILENYEIDLLLATSWEHHFAQELRHYFYYLHESMPHIPWFTPVNSHDSGVPAEEFADVRATVPRYILASLLGTGTTGHTQGVESGILHKIEFIGRHPPLHLPSGHADFRGLIKKTNELLVRYTAFQQQGNLSFIDANHPAIIAGLRRPRDVQKPTAIVIVNLDIHQNQSLELDLQALGLGSTPFWDAFTEQPMARHGSLLRCELGPCDFLVLLAGEMA